MTHRTSHRPAARRQGEYGVDAPYVPTLYGAMGIGLLAWGVVTFAVDGLTPAPWALFAGCVTLVCAGLYLYTTRRGKFVVWEKLLDRLALRGDERVLDLGCGRGAVLLAAARRLPDGRAYGVDLWRSQDQSGNDPATTERNARAEGVADRIELHTADMTQLPFESDQFDVVVSSLALHNISDPAGRTSAIEEAVRVLRPGGRLVVADIRNTRQYGADLQRLGMRSLTRRAVGARMWWSGPWMPTTVVCGTKPS
ncbi:MULTISPECIES: class I SAM-dependent methyltransferase [Streptomyces]|uniref:Class I SAM-dependent methyltransferase n=1 Tax=Streptomyces yunnanensis TaxID=156453 RepID=A0ABY8A0B5_9ACTN|nr:MULTISPECIES: class I SAM-dependent methyltransferase [Streptomyces]WEB38377.1 class I SAM-dependent methyltransferase [Streptomyces yunnanensis]